jgi:hypothetical protein
MSSDFHHGNKLAPERCFNNSFPVYTPNELAILQEAAKILQRSGGSLPEPLRLALPQYQPQNKATSGSHSTTAYTPQDDEPIHEADSVLGRNENRNHNSFGESWEVASAGIALNLESIHFDIQVTDSAADVDDPCFPAAFESQADYPLPVCAWRNEISTLDLFFPDTAPPLGDSNRGSGGSQTILTPPPTPHNHEREASASPHPEVSGRLPWIAPKQSAPILSEGSAFTESVLLDQFGRSVAIPPNVLSGVKARRRKFQDIRIQKETSLTRKLKACIRCRMQRIRVI